MVVVYRMVFGVFGGEIEDVPPSPMSIKGFGGLQQYVEGYEVIGRPFKSDGLRRLFDNQLIAMHR